MLQCCFLENFGVFAKLNEKPLAADDVFFFSSEITQRWDVQLPFLLLD